MSLSINKIGRFSPYTPTESMQLLYLIEGKVRAVASQAFENQEAAIRECWEHASALSDPHIAIKACKICAHAFPGEGTITFQFDEGEVTLPIYFRDILAKASSYFYGMLKGKFSEALSTHIPLLNFDLAYFKMLVELLEHGEEALKELEVEDLFNFAEQARMQELHTLAARVEGVMVRKFDSLEIRDLLLLAEKMATLKNFFLVSMVKRALLGKIASLKPIKEEDFAKCYDLVSSPSVFQDDKDVLQAIFLFQRFFAISKEETNKKREDFLINEGYKLRAFDLGMILSASYCSQIPCKLLAHCPNLKQLYLYRIWIENTTLIKVTNSCPNLQELRMEYCDHFEGHELVQLAALPALSRLTLASCLHLTKEGLLSLEALTALEEFRFISYHATEVPLSRLTQIKALFYDRTSRKLTPVELSQINSLTTLRALNLEIQETLVGNPLHHLTALTALEALKFTNYNSLFDGDLAPLTLFRNLKVLSLKGCNHLHSLAYLTTLTALRELEVFNCASLSSFADITPLTNLQTLDLTYTKNYNDDDLTHFTSLKNLRTLQLSASHLFTGSGLLHLTSLTNLHNLKIRGYRYQGSLPLEFHLPYLKVETNF